MKEKIIDCIIFEGNLRILNFRIAEVICVVDLIYIISDTNKKTSLLFSDLFVYKTHEKIKIINLEIPEDNKLNRVKNILINENLNFDDIICVSKEFELPDFDKFGSLSEILPVSIIILLQKKFTWSLDYFEENPHEGTIVFNFSTFFKRPNLLYTKNNLSQTFEMVENGWSFFGFDIEESISKSNLLPYGLIDKFRTKRLSKNTESTKFSNLDRFIKINDVVVREKKIFYVGDKETNLLCNEKMIFSRTYHFSLDLEFNQIFIPSIKFYESKNFENEYFLSEIIKFMSILFPLPHDEIIFNFDFMKEPKKVLWFEVENRDILEVLLN